MPRTKRRSCAKTAAARAARHKRQKSSEVANEDVFSTPDPSAVQPSVAQAQASPATPMPRHSKRRRSSVVVVPRPKRKCQTTAKKAARRRGSKSSEVASEDVFEVSAQTTSATSHVHGKRRQRSVAMAVMQKRNSDKGRVRPCEFQSQTTCCRRYVPGSSYYCYWRRKMSRKYQRNSDFRRKWQAVSYTHLTLPTIYSV